MPYFASTSAATTGSSTSSALASTTSPDELRGSYIWIRTLPASIRLRTAESHPSSIVPIQPDRVHGRHHVGQHRDEIVAVSGRLGKGKIVLDGVAHRVGDARIRGHRREVAHVLVGVADGELVGVAVALEHVAEEGL